MKNNLLKEEILRIKEIMGVSLIIESKLPASLFDELVTIFSKNNNDGLEMAIRTNDNSVAGLTKSISDTASTLGKQSDEIITGLRYGNLADDVAEELFVNVLKGADSQLKSVFLRNIDENISDIFNIAADGTKIVKTGTGEKTLNELSELNILDNWATQQKKIIDDSSFSNSLKEQMKRKLDDDILKIKRNSQPPMRVGNLEEYIDDLKGIAAANNKKAPTLNDLKKWDSQLKSTYKNAEDAWDAIKNKLDNLKKDKNFNDRIEVVGETVEIVAGPRSKFRYIFRNDKGKLRWGTLVAIVAAISLLDVGNLSESEANDYMAKFINSCNKLAGAIRKEKNISATLFEEFLGVQNDYIIKVIYDYKEYPVDIKDNEGYIELPTGPQSLSSLCSDEKLADGEFDDTSNTASKNLVATVDDFKSWWDSKKYADYTDITTDGPNVTVTVNGETFNYIKTAENKYEQQ